jgi:hypothetical protein
MPNEADPGFDWRRAEKSLQVASPETGTILEALHEIREILRDLDELERRERSPADGVDPLVEPAPEGGESGAAILMRSARLVVVPSERAAMLAPIAPPPSLRRRPRRRGAAAAMLAIFGLLVLGVAGLGVRAARKPALGPLAASAAAQTHSRAAGRPESAARAALPPVRPAAAKGALAPSLPALGQGPAPSAHQAVAQRSGGSLAAPASRPQALSSRHANAPIPAPPHPLAQTDKTSPVPASAAADRSERKRLREAGDMRILEGDIASARLFYERAAAAGDARAALALGNSFNPAFLRRLGVLGMEGDAAAAARWYRRARALGDPDAEKALKTLPR